MVRPHAAPAPLTLDPKRIAATSAVIALHVVAAMALMMPAVAPPRTTVPPPPVLEIIPTYKPPEIVPILPPPPHPITAPVTPRHPTTPTSAPVDIAPPSDLGIQPVLPPAFEHPTFDQQPPAPVSMSVQVDAGPAPPYPPMALRRHIEGMVLLRVLVDPGGNPTEVSIEHSSGSRLLDDSALRFVKARWHFRPATQNGEAISAYALVPVSFRIE